MFFIKQKNWKKLCDFCNAAFEEFSSEITGYMILEQNKDKDWEMLDPVILKQEVSGGTCEISKEDSANYFVESFDKYGQDVRFVWWHTHADMAAFWSSTDTKNMEDQCSNGWAASLVINIRGEYKFRVNYNDPIPAYVDTEITIENDSQKIPKKILAEVKEKCTKPTYVTKYNGRYQKPNGSQTSLYNGYNYVMGDVYNDEEDLKDWNRSFGVSYHNSHGSKTFSNTHHYNLYAELREQGDKYINGTLTWKEFRRWIIKTNKENAKNRLLKYEIDEDVIDEAWLQSEIATYGSIDYEELIIKEGRDY